MRARFRILALIVALLAVFAPFAVVAQQGAASLVADSIRVTPDARLIAQGNVEVFYQGRRLTARAITYDRSGDLLTIEGPLVLSEGTETIILADSAQLSGDMRDGLLLGARLVLNQQLQLAATDIARIGGRYTRLGQSVASSCRICVENETPLWEIRAASVIHDEQTRRIYFDRAQFRVRGVPIAYLPRLDVPDPSVQRATGFLAPEVRGSRALGAGIRIPYFIALAPDRDLLLTPYVTGTATVALEARYRQAFRTGTVELLGGVGRDNARPGSTRAYLLGAAEFDLGEGLRLTAEATVVSDADVLSHYGIGTSEVLKNTLALTEVARDRFARARITHFRSLRITDTNAELPNRVFDARFDQRIPTPALGGRAVLTVDILAAARASSTDILGRDVARASARLNWRREATLAGGLRTGVEAQLRADTFRTRQDSTFAPRQSRLTPAAAVDVRLPMARTGRDGSVQVIEPVAQFVWSRPAAGPTPNEDSRLLELDEASLWGIDRFSTLDVHEGGARANLGVNYSRLSPDGWTLGVAVGRVIRAKAPPPGTFTMLSGLDGRRSDWLAAARFDSGAGTTLAGRALFDDQFDLTKAELVFGWRDERLDLQTGIAHLVADPAEGRPTRASEWSVDASYALTEGWTALADWRYDMVVRRAASAGVGARFRNECLAVDLSVSRRFATTTSTTPMVDFGLRVDLIGFGNGTAAGPARRCVN